MRMIGAKFFTRTLTVWPALKRGPYGELEFDPPYTLKCWFKATNETYRNTNGEEKRARYKVLMAGENLGKIKNDDVIVVDRDETATLDPTGVPDSHTVDSIGVTAADAIESQDLLTVMV